MTLEEIAEYRKYVERAEMLIEKSYPVSTRDVYELAKHLQSIDKKDERVNKTAQTTF